MSLFFSLSSLLCIPLYQYLLIFVAWSGSSSSIDAVIPADQPTESWPKKGMLLAREEG